jgi:hypothetical protein
MRMQDVLDRLNDQPFRPFRIHMSDGSTFDVRNSGSILVGISSAIVTSEYGQDEKGRLFTNRWRTIALVHIVQFSDLDEHGRGNGRRRKAS